MLHRSSLRVRVLARRVWRTDGSLERAARGLSAGCFVAAFPLPGLHIPLSLALAWLVRGHKGLALIPQLLSFAGAMLPLAYMQYWIGTQLWPGHAPDAAAALPGVAAALEAWTWSAPVQCLQNLCTALGALRADVIGPLALGVAVSAAFLAALAYPAGLLGAQQLHLYRMRQRARLGLCPRPPRPPLVAPPATEILPEPAAIQRFMIHRQTYVRADAVKLLIDGRQAYPEMLGCIGAARESVDLETYILCADLAGRRFAAALAAAAGRGVRTRLMYDGIGGLGLPQEYVTDLLAAGVQVAVYRPLSKLWRSGLGPLNRRNHRKILLIDGRIGFTGGLNIGDDYAAREDGGGGWRDTHVRLDGAVPASLLAALFQETWAVADHFEPLPAFLESSRTVDASGAGSCVTNATSYNATVQVLSNKEFLQRVRMRRAYVHAIRHARYYILIENAYFIPDRGIRRALYAAVRRGVTVAVAVAMYSDVRIAAMASRALYGELLAGGVRLYEYPISMLHSKVAVIDDVWSMVSSYNLDHRSLLHNLEAGVLLLDRPFAQALRMQIMQDIASSREVQRHVHEARPWNQALLESLAYQMRYWL